MDGFIDLTTNPGPLAGIGLVEFAGIGPAPFAARLLADLGADVVCIASPRIAPAGPAGLSAAAETRPARTTVVLDLRSLDGQTAALERIARADVLLEGFRPGVMERLGLSPERCHRVNPGLVFGRVTGWGQDGPLAARAGHDINYLAVSGALSLVGPEGGAPVPPVNMVADFGGGAMFLITGILAGLVARARHGAGCVVDAAMIDGVGWLTESVRSLRRAGQWRDERGVNLLDGGAPFYTTYRCADGRWIALGALEPRFFEILRSGLSQVTDVDAWPGQYDRDRWPELRSRLDAVFSRRERDVWAEMFADTDACLSPVLSLDEAAHHPQVRARAGRRGVDGALDPAPAPRVRPAQLPPR